MGFFCVIFPKWILEWDFFVGGSGLWWREAMWGVWNSRCMEMVAVV
ncbi:hypothetical protein Hanom_Chr10g00901261 [Helianthus anomalus]